MGKKKKIVDHNKVCWADGCDLEIREWPYCEKHHRMTLKGHKIQNQVPGIKGFDNTPTKV